MSDKTREKITSQNIYISFTYPGAAESWDLSFPEAKAEKEIFTSHLSFQHQILLGSLT